MSTDRTEKYPTGQENCVRGRTSADRAVGGVGSIFHAVFVGQLGKGSPSNLLSTKMHLTEPLWKMPVIQISNLGILLRNATHQHEGKKGPQAGGSISGVHTRT